MWKSGWKINKDWVKGKEKWMLPAGVWTDSSDSVISAGGEQKDKEGRGGVSGRPGAAGAGGKEGDSDSQTAAGKISGTQEDRGEEIRKEMEQRCEGYS